MTDQPNQSSASPTVGQLFDLSGRVAMITGARGYLGRAMADALAEAGARVVATSRDAEAARRTAAELGGPEAGQHIGVGLDHLDHGSLDDGFDEAVRLAGGVDILVNNGHQPIGADWKTVDGDQFQQQLANLTGYFLLARRLHDHAVDRQVAANVIFLGSMYGVVGSYPEVYQGVCAASPAAYHALKGGIIHLTRHLAVSWAADRVRVNCLSPGPFPGPQAPPELVARLREKSPLRRMGSPHELKGAIVFLASDASSYVTGQNMLVDGGWTAW